MGRSVTGQVEQVLVVCLRYFSFICRQVLVTDKGTKVSEILYFVNYGMHNYFIGNVFFSRYLQ